MERYQMNRPCGRPYQTTCGMSKPQMQHRRMDFRADNTDCQMDSRPESHSERRMDCRPESHSERRMDCRPESHSERRMDCRPESHSERRMDCRPESHSERRMDSRNERMAEQTKCERKQECRCHMPGFTPREAEMYEHVDHMTVAMAYVPCQRFTDSFDLCYAFQAGTIFPDLCKPFCGKGGACKC